MRRRFTPFALAVTLFSLAMTVAVNARADAGAEPPSDGATTHAPVSLLVTGGDSLPETSLVLTDCAGEHGKHAAVFVSATQSAHCHSKKAPHLYALKAAEKKALDELLAKDSGMAAELPEVKKLVAKGLDCGTIDETGAVERRAHAREVAAKYAVEKTAAGCATKKLFSSAVKEMTFASTGASHAVAPPPAPTEPAPPPASAQPPKKKSGCSAAPGVDQGPATFAFALAAAIGIAFARRRRQLPASGKSM